VNRDIDAALAAAGAVEAALRALKATTAAIDADQHDDPVTALVARGDAATALDDAAVALTAPDCAGQHALARWAIAIATQFASDDPAAARAWLADLRERLLAEERARVDVAAEPATLPPAVALPVLTGRIVVAGQPGKFTLNLATGHGSVELARRGRYRWRRGRLDLDGAE
jgi:hypothetical protein